MRMLLDFKVFKYPLHAAHINTGGDIHIVKRLWVCFRVVSKYTELSKQFQLNPYELLTGGSSGYSKSSI